MEKMRRRREILDAARTVFASRGYHESAVSDIIETAGIARGTFYLYFGSKRAVFDELLDKFLVEVQSCVQKVVIGPGLPPPYEQLHGNISRVLALLLEEQEMTRIVLNHAVGLDDAADRKLATFYDHLAAALVRALETGRRFGIVTADPVIASRLVLGGIRELVAFLLRKGSCGKSHEEIVAEVLNVGLRGVVGGPVPELHRTDAFSPGDAT